MKIFLTGATGYIGSVVAEKLKGAGYEVLALARKPAALAHLANQGYEPVPGDLADSATLSANAQRADGVIHLAQMRFDPQANFMNQMKASSQLQLNAVNALLRGLAGSGKPIIITGGTGAYRDTGRRIVDEDTPVKAPPLIAGLAMAENNVLHASDVQGMAIRPAIVFGRNSGPVMQVMAMSKAAGRVQQSGAGQNALSFVHVDDVADLYLLMLKNAKAGILLNAVAEPFLTQHAVLNAISHALGFGGKVVVKNKWIEQFQMLLGKGTYNIFGNTMRVSAARAKALGWQPRAATTLFAELRSSDG